MRRQTVTLLDAYEAELPKYELLTKKLELLVKEILDSNGLMFQSVSGRTKDRKSLAKKIESKPRGHYTSLDAITDLSGVRVITYFSDDVDHAAEVISKEFDIDQQASIDKRNQHGPDAFGYMSMHFIVSLTNERCKLSEYKRLKGVKAEIQIRSVLQHAWAEIEHDLGYKSEGAIPRHLRRRFSRLASLLELGDEEFVTIRNHLSEYQQVIKRELIDSPQTVEIDKVSLTSFLQSEYMQALDQEIAKATDIKISPTSTQPDYLSEVESYAEFNLDRLAFLNIETIGQLETELNKFRQEIPSFANKWITLHRSKMTKEVLEDSDHDVDEGDRSFPPGIGLFYFALMSLSATKDFDMYYRYWIEVSKMDQKNAKRNAEFLKKM